MRRLRQQQRVEIHLDYEDEILGCRVAAVEGSLATLARVDEAPVEVLESLVPAASGLLVLIGGFVLRWAVLAGPQGIGL